MSIETEDKLPEEGTSSAPGTAEGPNSSAGDLLNLSALDKIKRFFFSKEEWEAYLLEKLEEEKKKKDNPEGLDDEQVEIAAVCEDMSAGDGGDKKSVLSWIKTVFPSQDDANSFLKKQLDKLQEVKGNVTNLVSQSSTDVVPSETGDPSIT